MGQTQLIISIVTIALFSIAIIGFSIDFARDNDAAVDISEDPEISNLYANTTSGLQNTKTSTQNTYTSLINSTINPGSDTLESPGVFSLVSGDIIGVTKNVFKVGYAKIFGSNSKFNVFLTTGGLIIVFLLAMYIWKTFKGGNPD